MHELENIEHRDGESWEEHLKKFHEILNNLSALDKATTDDENSSKPIRTSPANFVSFEMVYSHMIYEYLVNSVEAGMSRSKFKQQDKP